MELMEALLWISLVKQAREGEKEAQEALQAENEIRKAKGLPTIEEELIAMARDN